MDQDRRNQKLRNELTEFDGYAVLNDLLMDDLRTIAAEVGRQTGEYPENKRTKQAIIGWLKSGIRWSRARGVLRYWLEQRKEIEEQRKREALKQFGA